MTADIRTRPAGRRLASAVASVGAPAWSSNRTAVEDAAARRAARAAEEAREAEVNPFQFGFQV